MLRPGQTLRVPFVCVDSTGAAAAPTGTPTATLYRNGTSQADVVTVTMSSAQGVASVAIPSGWSQGDAVCLLITATISGTAYPVFSPTQYLSNLPAVAGDAMTLTAAYDSAKTAAAPGAAMTLTSAYDAAKTAAAPGAAMTLTSGERTAIANEVETQIIDDTDSEKVLKAITDKIAAANPSLSGLTLAAIASQVRTELSVELARIDAAISSRLAAAGYTAPTTPPTAVDNAAAVRTELAIELGRIDASIGSRSAPGSAMTLTSGERTAIANEVEAQIIDDTDTEKVLKAITDKIAAANPDLSGLTLAAIASQVRTELSVELARIDAAISSRLAAAGYTAPPSALSNGAAAANSILSNPANKLATNLNGYVTSTNGGGGGSGTQLVVPIVTESGGRVSSKPIVLFIDEQMWLSLTLTDANGNPIDLTGKNLELRMSRPPASVRTLADLRSFELSAKSHDDWEEVDSVGDLTGDSEGRVDLDIPEFLTVQSGPVSGSVRDADTGETLSKIHFMVEYAA